MNYQNRTIQNYLRKKDKILNKLIKRIGNYNPKFFEPTFGSLYQIIISQSLSKEASEKIFSRFIILFNGNCLPEKVLRIPYQSYRKIGLSKQKINTIKLVSRLLISKNYKIKNLSKMSDDEIIKILTSIKGIGPWTAQIFLILCLRRLDVFPTDDAWLLHSIKKEYNFKTPVNAGKIFKISERWKPYRSVATWYLWKSFYPDSRI